MEDLCKVYREFLGDFLNTFPEYKETIASNDGLIDILAERYDTSGAEMIVKHCQTVYPPHFFNILYQSEEVFANDVEFIPSVNFKTIWADTELTEKTREVIWSYLQLVLFNTVSTIKDSDRFGETASLFEAIDEETLKQKMAETIEQMKSMFNENTDTSDNIPTPEDLNHHLQGLMSGKLGMLANELAQETAADLGINLDDHTAGDAVIKNLFKNPAKLLPLIKKIGNRLEEKMKSGELDQKEIMKEASETIKNMKMMGDKVPQMRQIQRMMKRMGGLDAIGKMMGGNTPFVPTQLKREMETSNQKERMLRKLEERKKNVYVFSTGETPDKTTTKPETEHKAKRKPRRKRK
jgi:cell fate (sporulation/competence/biofilm development) regulator YlbF (YheA/YmcA/DUF963 family)